MWCRFFRRFKLSVPGRRYILKFLAMKKNDEIKTAVDEIVVDGRDVERAEDAAMKRRDGDKRVEHTRAISDDELLTSAPE